MADPWIDVDGVLVSLKSGSWQVDELADVLTDALTDELAG